MMRNFLVLLTLLLSTSITSAQDRDLIELNDFLVAEKLPSGYEVSIKDLKKDGKVAGKVITVSHPTQIPRVTIQCEFQEVADVESKREYVKTNFKAYASSLVKLGYKTVDKNIPDFDQLTFEEPLAMTVHFFNDERKLWTFHRFLFTDKTIWVKATADKPDTLEEIKNWAKTIQPKSLRK